MVAPSLDVFKDRLDGVLGSLIWWGGSPAYRRSLKVVGGNQSMAGGLDYMVFKPLHVAVNISTARTSKSGELLKYVGR